ncbi:MAG: GntR family transcriptional regulator [Puniceicoccales bacterium]
MTTEGQLEVAAKDADIVQTIISMLHSGYLRPDKRIGEASLSSELELPRGKVRSALEQLKQIGVLVRVPRSGTFLKSITLDSFCESIDVRAALEALAVRLFCVKASPAMLTDLKKLAARVDELNQEVIAGNNSVYPLLMNHDLEFHATIAENSGNVRLFETLKKERLIEYTFCLLESETKVPKPSADLPVPAHMEIAEALCEGDANRAEVLMRQHILRTKTLRLLRYTGEMV